MSNNSNRRKSVGHIPLSPLARTPSPSPLPASPTRSPSPLAFPVIVHQPGKTKMIDQLRTNYNRKLQENMFKTLFNLNFSNCLPKIIFFQKSFLAID